MYDMDDTDDMDDVMKVGFTTLAGRTISFRFCFSRHESRASLFAWRKLCWYVKDKVCMYMGTRIGMEL